VSRGIAAVLTFPRCLSPFPISLFNLLEQTTRTTMMLSSSLTTSRPLLLLLLLVPCWVSSFVPDVSRPRSSRNNKWPLSAQEGDQLSAALLSSLTSSSDLASSSTIVTSAAGPAVSLQDLQGAAARWSSILDAGAASLEQVPLELRVVALAAPLLWYVVPILRSTRKPEQATYPEQKSATYEMSQVKLPFEFGAAAFVRPLLKQTQLEFRPLQVAYDAKKGGFV